MSEMIYPDDPAGPYQPPPVLTTADDGTEIEIRAYDGSEQEREALVEMYRDFDAADRAQGIPPGSESRIREWLGSILESDCHNVIAWSGDDAAGHATLVPDDGSYELAIFVNQPYQGIGIGTELIETLLGHGAENDVERVWLSVERWNRAAIGLYKKVGFETSDAESFELEMAARLTPADG